MRILPDGSVEIRNKKTGAKKIVMPDELPNYGISYSTYESELKSFKNTGGETKTEIVEKKNELTEGERTKQNLARTGIKAASDVERIYSDDPGILTKQLIPGKFMSRSYDSALFAAVDTLLRIRTGAQAPETEVRKYMSAFGPNFGDTPEDAAYKLTNLKNALMQEGNLSEEEVNTLVGQGTKKKEQQPSKSPQSSSGQVDLSNIPVLGGLSDLLVPRTKKLPEQAVNLTQKQQERPSAKGNILESLKRATSDTADVAAAAIPAGVELALLTSPLSKLGLVKGGVLAGGLTGATTPDVSPEERIKKTLGGIAGGALVGGVLKGTGKIVNSAGDGAKRLITQVFKPNASELRDFKKFSGQDFADEVMKRDLPFIKGKNGQQILEYYTGKVQELDDAADEFLSQLGKTIDKNEVVRIVEKALSSRQGRVLQDAANNQLEKLKVELTNLPDKIPATAVNQIKRDLQTAGKAAYGPSGNPSPASEALAGVARELNTKLDDTVKGVKDINKTIQFYHLAKDSIERKLNQAAGSEGGLVSQLLAGGGFAGLGIGAATGNPVIAGASVLPALLNALYRTPQAKTQVAPIAQKLGQARMPEILEKLLLLGGGRAGSSF